MSRILCDTENQLAEDKIYNVEIPNLSHRTYNGTSRTMDKTIYRVMTRTDQNAQIDDNTRITEFDVPDRVYIPLNNPTEITLNQLDVKITDVEGKTETELLADTYVNIDIRD